jgi:DNA-binding NtrC family response regulator
MGEEVGSNPEVDEQSGSERGVILLIDDDPGIRKALTAVLKRRGHLVMTAGNATEGLQFIEDSPVDLVLSDIQMPGMTGLELLPRIKRMRPETEVIMMTGFGTVERAVEALKEGAYDFLTKPFEDIEAVERVVDKALERGRLLAKASGLQSRLELEVGERFEGIVGSSRAMRSVYELIDSVSGADAHVLIRGESGTGKELVAKALHYRSPRRSRPFVVINCSALTETLLESELFGHVKGAFTGATAHKRGLFEEAHRGTLFLDEIGDVSPIVQVKMLRAVQEGEIRRVGSNENIRVDVRVLAATNRNLEEAMASGEFREDLYYRLNVIGIRLPPLRERVEDVPLLAHHFLQKYAGRMSREISDFAEDVMDVLQTYRWPGNVRELENVVERAVVLTREGQVQKAALPDRLRSDDFLRNASATHYGELEFRKAKSLAVNLFERRYMQALLTACDGNVSEASRRAGMDRSNFRRILKKHDIQA